MLRANPSIIMRPQSRLAPNDLKFYFAVQVNKQCWLQLVSLTDSSAQICVCNIL